MYTTVLDRRTFVLGACAVAAITPLLAEPAGAQQATQGWEEALQKIVGEGQPVENGRLVFELPEIAENGNMVQFTISTDSPMSDKDNVRAIHILATANPLPSVASFRFSPLSGKASVTSRMRLARTQDVIGLAEFGDGKFLMARRLVKVTIGGCGG